MNDVEELYFLFVFLEYILTSKLSMTAGVLVPVFQ